MSPAPDSPAPALILVAERDGAVRELQRVFLERAGYAVAFVPDGEAAFTEAVRSSPAALVTEILLPRVDGLALCRRLRADPLTRDIPVVVFSMLAAAERAAEAGAAAFLRKPLVETVFIAAIRDAIGTSSLAPSESA